LKPSFERENAALIQISKKLFYTISTWFV